FPGAEARQWLAVHPDLERAEEFQLQWSDSRLECHPSLRALPRESRWKIVPGSPRCFLVARDAAVTRIPLARTRGRDGRPLLFSHRYERPGGRGKPSPVTLTFADL